MLCFVFAALIVALDQFFKQWILRTLDVGEVGPEVIPGILGLTRWENDGAMLNILSGQQWLLAGIAFVAAIVLIMILLRYNEGFWGTLGLAAVLGGTIGNLIDRIFNEGRVVDMFRTLPINFPIFNIADIFITLGFVTFLIHFIALSFTADKRTNTASDYEDGEYYDEQGEGEYDEFPEIDNMVGAQSEPDYTNPNAQYSRGAAQSQYAPNTQQSQGSQQYAQQSPEYQYESGSQYASDSQYAPDSQYVNSHVSEPQYTSESQYSYDTDISMPDDYDSITDTTSDNSYTLDALEAELGSLDDYGDYSVDDLLREYGFEDDDNK